VKNARAGAWLILLALAGAQAWSARFYITPDGVSYMDLSDAVITGQWGELLNAYWSPLYPALIGLIRAATRPTPYWEFVVVHALNLALFAASLAGFEYLLAPLRDVARKASGRTSLDTARGLAGVYAIFGVFTLMMTPLVLPTPDLLVSAASLFAFGALLRLANDAESRRAGVVLGVALAAGSLAKSFVIPWAGVCLVTAFVATRRFSRRPVVTAAAVWLAPVLLWTAGLSEKYGHLTFGDTGRLTYVWYVNQVEMPSAKHMPHGAAVPATDSVLRGVAVTPNAPGTNPVWYDPARWYSDLHPQFVARRQVRVFSLLVAEYIASLAPMFLVITFWILAAGRTAVQDWWRRVWPVALPAIAALFAYAMVLVTTRYVAPFYMTILLLVLYALPWPDRIPPIRMMLAIGVPLIFMAATPEPGKAMALVNSAVASGLFVWAARYRTTAVMVVAAVVGAMCVWFLQSFGELRYVWMMTVLLILSYWMVSRSAEEREEWPIVSPLIRRSLVAANAILVLMVAQIKYLDSLSQQGPGAGQPNASWAAAGLAASVGIKAGSKIALIGSPFDTYWARVGRVKIVAVVPPPRMKAFYELPAAERRRLYDAFAKAGADFVVVQHETSPEGPDQSWRGIRYIGWVKRIR
jgi:hypothetical protein